MHGPSAPALQNLRVQIDCLHDQIREQVREGALSYMPLPFPEAQLVQQRLIFALAQLATLKERAEAMGQ